MLLSTIFLFRFLPIRNRQLSKIYPESGFCAPSYRLIYSFLM